MSSEQAREHLGQISNSLERMESQLAELRGELTATAARLEEPPKVEAPPSNGSAPTGRLELEHVNDALRKLAQGQEQERILEIFLEEAQSYVQRAILFLNQDGKYVTWKGFGFQPEAIRSLVLSDPQETIVQSAERRQLVYRRDHPEDSLPWLKSAGEIPSSVFCIPLVFENSVPVVFYGDSNDTIAIDSLELLTHLAVLVLKNNYLHQQLNAQKEMASVEAPPTPVEEPTAREEAAEETPEEKAEESGPGVEDLAAGVGVAAAAAFESEAAEVVEELEETPEPAFEEPEEVVSEVEAGEVDVPAVEERTDAFADQPLEELELEMEAEAPEEESGRQEPISAEAAQLEAPAEVADLDIPLEKKEIDFEFDFAAEEEGIAFEIDLDATPGIEAIEAEIPDDDASISEEAPVEVSPAEEPPSFEAEAAPAEAEEPAPDQIESAAPPFEEPAVQETDHISPDADEGLADEVAESPETAVEEVLAAPIFAEPALDEPLEEAPEPLIEETETLIAESPVEEEAWDPSEAETEDELPVVTTAESELTSPPPEPPEETLSAEPAAADEIWDPSEAETEEALPTIEPEESEIETPEEGTLSAEPDTGIAPPAEEATDDSYQMVDSTPVGPPEEILGEPDVASSEETSEETEGSDLILETAETAEVAEGAEARGEPWAEAFEEPRAEAEVSDDEIGVEAVDEAGAGASEAAEAEVAPEEASGVDDVAELEPDAAPEESVAAAEESAEEADPAPLTEEEKKAHDEARRFARLLVSEIKLYNEDDVEAGRQHSDLYRRLRRDVDRSREMFDRRVSGEVATSVDYFHQEMVRILGKGDAGLLGEDYPGPRVADDGE